MKLVLCVFACSIGLPIISSAQSCPTYKSNGGLGVLPGETLYYSVSSSLTSLPSGTGAGAGSTPGSQISAAISSWNNANQSNGTGVTFLPADANNPATITFTAGTLGGNTAAQTQPQSPGAITASNPVTVVLNVSNTNIYSSTTAGYSTFFAYTAAHEIGHIMGIGDVNVPQGTPANQIASLPADVMNPSYGVNNSFAQNPTIAPTQCDNQAANAAAQAMLSLNPPGGGGYDPSEGVDDGGGGGDNGDPIGGCNYYDQWDASSDTLEDDCSG